MPEHKSPDFIKTTTRLVLAPSAFAGEARRLIGALEGLAATLPESRRGRARVAAREAERLEAELSAMTSTRGDDVARVLERLGALRRVTNALLKRAFAPQAQASARARTPTARHTPR
ncbi:MAG: hypothetical protein HOW73_29150 [Polyangiaceae bacterium]|nr:hypothetical protein [Polyangiaceae bacterium]